MQRTSSLRSKVASTEEVNEDQNEIASDPMGEHIASDEADEGPTTFIEELEKEAPVPIEVSNRAPLLLF
jgi:hypothetical protein